MSDNLEAWLDEHDPTHLGDRLAILQMKFMAFSEHPDPFVRTTAERYLKQVNKMLQDINDITEMLSSSQDDVGSA